jgi:hypothetical protein
MSRKPSPETELRNLRREFREVLKSKNDYQREAMALRGQLNKAYAETGEWKHRFDQLLAKAKSFETTDPTVGAQQT